MDMTVISIYVSMLALISGAAERLVQILQKTVQLVLNVVAPNVKLDTTTTGSPELFRHIIILTMSFGCCYFTSSLVLPMFPQEIKIPNNDPILLKGHTLTIALLSMAGASFWNSIQGWLNGVKKDATPLLSKIKPAQEKLALAEKASTEAGVLETQGNAVEALKRLEDAKKLRDEAQTLLAQVGG